MRAKFLYLLKSGSEYRDIFYAIPSDFPSVAYFRWRC